jgi:uncharacterized UPF0146 family protein
MAQLIGIINEISGVFYAKGSDGETRVLKSGDQLFVGETIIGDSANGAQSFITFALAEGGKEYTVNGNEQLLLDSSILPSQLASDNVVQPEDLEEALMLDTTYDDASGAQADAAGEEIANAEDIENLEETAAAGTTEVDALAGRFEDRTGDEIDITTDLRDATFPAGTDTVIDEGEDLVAENLPPDITVDPGNPTGADDVVYESGMAVGSDSSSNTEFAYGTFTVSDPDGLADVQSVSINGITIPIAELGNNNVIQSLYGLGTLTVTSYDSTTGVAEYQYELTSATTDVEGVAETDTFVLTAYDGNVDSAEADITINIVDDVPSVDVGLLYGGDFQLPVLTTFDENTIGDNSDSGSGAIPFGGLFTLTQNMGADQGGTPASLNYELSFSNSATGLTSNGEDITLVNNNGVIEGRTSLSEPIFTISVDGSGNVTLIQNIKIDHVGEELDGSSTNNDVNTAGLLAGNVILTATASITDADGDTATDSETIDISSAVNFIDDVPSMSVSGAATVAEDATSAVSGSWDNANAGADEAASTVVVIGSNEYALGSDINLTEGTLNVATDGTWTFDPNTGLDQDSPQSVTFSVKVTDNDGDVASDNHTITITDGTGPSDADAITLTTDEADMSADDTGTLNFTFGSDAFESMAFSTDLTGLIEDTNATESGNDVVWTRTSATEITGTIDGQLAITLTLTPNLINGTASVKADIADNFDSIFANNGTNTLTLGSVDVIATDIDGDTAEGTVNVEVVDDVPSMSVSGAATVAEDATSAVSGSWDNANAGADEAASTVVVIGSNEYALGSDINLTEGTLNVATDGTWTFDPNTGLDQDSPQSVTFSVKVTDNDGDVASDNHTITITDGTGPSDADAITLTTDEADMSADDTGTLNFTFGSDAFESMAFSTDLTGLIEDTNATESGNDVVWTRTSATEITGTIDGQLAITLTLTPNLINGTASVKADIADNFDSIFANNGTNTLTLGSVDVIATDIDGDTAEGTVNVEVVDDVPTITSVESAVLDNEASGYTDGGSVLSIGADQPGSADLTGNIDGWDGTAVTFAASTLTSGGETVYYFVDPLNTGVLYGYTDSAVTAGEYDSSSTTQSLIFTLSYNTNGDYVIDMNGKLDSSTQTFGSTFNETIGGNQDYLLITDTGEIYKPGETVPATENVIMSVDSAGGEVNSSVQGLASDSQWVVGTDEIYFTFTNPVVSASFSIGIQSNAASNEVHWTAYGTDGDGNLVQESGDTVFSNGVLQEIPTTLTSIVSVHLSDNDGGNGFRVSGSEIVASVVEDPLNTSFEVAITDEDGDTASSTLDVQFNPVVEGRFIVGSSEDDVSGSTDLHTVPQASIGTLEGGAGDDVVSGDPGGTTLVPGSTANIVFVLDTSGSMGSENIQFGNGTTTRIEALKSSVIDSLNDLAASGADGIRVHLVEFNSDGDSLGTYDLSTASGLAAAISAINALNANGGTNYEAGLVEANNWITSTGADAPFVDADVNKVVFVSDGEPNYALNNDGNPVDTSTWTNDGSELAMKHVLGTEDSTNEVTIIENNGFEIEAIGINVTSDNLALLSQLEGVGGDATNVTSAEELTSVIGELSGSSTIQDAVADDYIEGGEGNDLIFGDVFNTDQLAEDQGLSTPEGSGWLVFQQLENGNGTTTDWDRTDTLQYILDNQQALAEESGRSGGNDEIYGGAGDDVIFGQEGADSIDGGEGSDTIYGGSGDDTIVFDPADTIDGGAGNDTLFISNSMNLDFSNVNSIDSSRIDNIETIDLSGGGSNVVTNLTVDDVFDMTATDNNINTLKIIGDGASDSVKVDTTTEWTDTNTTTNIDGINYNVYDNSGSVVGDPTVTLLVQQDIVEEI